MSKIYGYGGEYNGREIRGVALDIEGCISTANRRIIGQDNRDAAGRIQRRYSTKVEDHSLPLLFAVTGRPGAYLEHVFQDIGIQHPAFKIPSIVENGSIFWNNEKIEPEGYHPVVDKSRKELAKIRKFVESLKEGEYGQNMREESGKEICISLDPIELRVEQLYRLVREELDKKGYLDIVDITHSSSAVDITPKGISKKSALEHLLEKLDIDPQHILGVGDTKGDVDWLNYVGIPCAPINATEDLRKGVKDLHISRYTETEGVFDILHEHILMHSTERS